jgi:uncharacterized protein (DUF3820 family)
MAKLTDSDPMPFGKHKGERMEDVPASYLLWLHNDGCQNPGVAAYIEESMSALTLECPDTLVTKKP